MKLKSTKYCLKNDDKLEPSFLKSNVPEEKLLKDLDLITDYEIKEYIEKHDLLRKIEKSLSKADKELECKLIYLIEFIEKEVNQERWKCLLKNKDLPYDSEKFKKLNIEVDKFNLISFRDYVKKAQSKKYRICQFKCSRSNDLLFNTMMRMHKYSENIPQVRLDPVIISDNRPKIEFELLHGPEVNWETLSKLKEYEIKSPQYETNNIRTQIKWIRKDDRLEYECEEIPTTASSQIIPTRYMHADYDLNTGKIIHCDGSVNIYLKEKFENRKNVQLTHSNSHTSNEHVKIFLVKDLEREGFDILQATFFYDNPDIEKILKKLNEK